MLMIMGLLFAFGVLIAGLVHLLFFSNITDRNAAIARCQPKCRCLYCRDRGIRGEG